MQSPFSRFVQKALGAFVCAAAVFAAGCHNNNNDSGYGIGFVTLTSETGPFTSYTVNVDSITLTGKTVGVVTAVSTVETVDFMKLTNLAELWDAASIPNDTYTEATITFDYTAANISVMINGQPHQAQVVDSTGTTATTISVTVSLDPANLLTIVPTYATTDAQRLAIDFNLAASNTVNYSTSPVTVTAKPFLTLSTSASDTRLIRIRGPLTNSSLTIGTYTVYVRPFYDEVDSLGQVTIFNDANTSYLINGTYYTGSPGLSVLSQLSAGTTVTAAYTTYEPTPTTVAGTTAAKFNSTYVVAGSTLEDYYTQGLEGDVVGRTGNALSVIGSTLSLNDGTSEYNEQLAQVLLGPSTIVTADDNPAVTGLNYNSISVGQHIIARGIYELPASGVVTLDSTGASSTNTGSVRLVSTQLFGTLTSSSTGSLLMDLQTINNWPVGDFYWGGNGRTVAQDPVPAAYIVDTGALTPPAGAVPGSPLWVNGLSTPFGTAPPDFRAYSLPSESSLPATLVVTWTGTGTTAPFATLTDTGLTIDLANANYGTGTIQIGSETIDLSTLPATTITPAPPVAPNPAGVPSVFLPMFSIGNPATSAVTATDTTSQTTTLAMYNTYAAFVTAFGTTVSATEPVVKFAASGFYYRASNTFIASSIYVVL